MADSYRQILLKHRNASTLQQRLESVISEQAAIITDGQQIILRGSEDELDQLEAIIRRLDVPIKHVEVVVYRGQNPHVTAQNHSHLRWSTSSGQLNQMQSVVIQDGSSLLITETQLKAINQANVDELGYVVGSDLIPNAAYRLQGQGQGQKVVQWERGIELTSTLIGDEKVDITATFSLPRENTQQLLSQVETVIQRVIKQGVWTELTNQSLKSEPTPLMTRRQIRSTEKNDEYDDAVWIKVTKLK